MTTTFRRSLLAILLSMTFFLPGPSMAGMAEAVEAYVELCDFDFAFPEFKRLAEEGNTEAQFKVGWMYVNGQGVRKDLIQAAYWYKLAADKGHLAAKTNLPELTNE